jgi:cyclic pyranopterin phosphate synthase
MIKIDSLRISVTNRWNSRCLYCMTLYGANFTNKDELLTYEEILYIVKIILVI